MRVFGALMLLAFGLVALRETLRYVEEEAEASKTFPDRARGSGL